MSKKIISNAFLLLVLASVGFAGFQTISPSEGGFVFTDFQEMTMSGFADFLAEKALEKKGTYFVHITSADCKINLDNFRDFASSTNYVTVSKYSIEDTSSGKSQDTFYPGYYVFSVKDKGKETVSISGKALKKESTSLPDKECISKYQGVRADQWAGFGKENAGILYSASNLVYPEDQGEECGNIVAWWGAAQRLTGMGADRAGCDTNEGVPMPRVYYRVVQDILGLEPKDCSGTLEDCCISHATEWMKNNIRYDSFSVLKYNDTAIYYDGVNIPLTYYNYYATVKPKVDKGTEMNPKCFGSGIQRFWWIVDYLYCVKGSKCMESDGSRFVAPCSAKSGYGTCCHGDVLYSDDGKPHCCPSGYSKVIDFGNGNVRCFKS
ncbi:MAG: hypothetical protein QW735_00855 [archaeon]